MPEKKFPPDGTIADEKYTMLKHAGFLSVETGLPVYDWKYQKQYMGRLNLYEATLTMIAEGFFGRVRASVFGSFDPKLIVMEYDDRLREAVSRTVRLERIASRLMPHGTHGLVPDVTAQMEGARARVVHRVLVIEQILRKLKFAVACLVEGEDGQFDQISSRSVAFVTRRTDSVRLRIYLSVAHSEECDDPPAAALARVREGARRGIPSLRKLHRRHWASFWGKSYVSLSDPYWEKLWYLNLYQLGSSCCGKYPPHFIGSIWTTTKDIRRWNHLFHWNMQETLWPLYGAGHPELAENWHRFHLEERLPRALADARTVHHQPGAFFTDIYFRDGTQCTFGNKEFFFSPGLQVALYAYWHFRFTGDRAFLRTNAYPIIKAVLVFYLAQLQKNRKGAYEIPTATIYEMNLPPNRARNPLPDIFHLQILAGACLEVAKAAGETDEEFLAKLREVADKIYRPALIPIPRELITRDQHGRMCYRVGPFRGKPVEATRIFPLGYEWKSGKPLTMASPTKEQYLFEAAADAPVFPSKAMGMGTKAALKKIIRTTINSAYAPGVTCSCGHVPRPIVAARLGDARQFEKLIEVWIDEFQHFCNGLWNYMFRDYSDENATSRSFYQKPEPDGYYEVALKGMQPLQKTLVPRDEFIHVGLEPGNVFQTALQEALVSDHDGITYLYAAMPDHVDVSFKLWSEAGVCVRSSRQKGKILFVELESAREQKVLLRNPWARTEITGKGKKWVVKNAVICLLLKASQKCVLRDATARRSSNLAITLPRHDSSGTEWMKRGRAVLGRPRLGT